jgi:hypothetical protein
MEEELPRVGKQFRIAGLLARDRAFSGSAVKAVAAGANYIEGTKTISPF